MDLFGAQNDGVVTVEKLHESLLGLEVADCDVLYVHSSLNFGEPLASRSTVLSSVAGVFLGLGVPTIVFPTFTFSFCTPEKFDVQNSASRMGAMNEYFRKMAGSVRTVDPMLSHAVSGRPQSLNLGPCDSSLGQGSFYEQLDQVPNVKFLFFGVHPGKAFTYMHHLERLAGVDYRYDRLFPGEIAEGGKIRSHVHSLFVRYEGVVANDRSYVWADDLVQKGKMAMTSLGDSHIWVASLDEAKADYMETLESDPHYFVDFLEVPCESRTDFKLGRRDSL